MRPYKKPRRRRSASAEQADYNSLGRALSADMRKHQLAEDIHAGWTRYVDLFGVPPHGTMTQLLSLVELMPKREK